MQKRAKSSLIKNEDGFTLIEVMLALTIVSLLGIMIWQGLTKTGKLIEKIYFSSSTTLKIMEMEKYLRRMSGKIVVPFWVSEITIEEGNNVLTIPFYEGNSNSNLFLKFENNYLVIGCNDTEKKHSENMHTFGPFSKVTFKLARNRYGDVFGIKFTIHHLKKSNEPIIITTSFQSNPFLINKP